MTVVEILDFRPLEFQNVDRLLVFVTQRVSVFLVPIENIYLLLNFRKTKFNGKQDRRTMVIRMPRVEMYADLIDLM